MKVSTEIDNNIGYEKITQLVDNIPLNILFFNIHLFIVNFIFSFFFFFLQSMLFSVFVLFCLLLFFVCVYRVFIFLCVYKGVYFSNNLITKNFFFIYFFIWEPTPCVMYA